MAVPDCALLCVRPCVFAVAALQPPAPQLEQAQVQVKRVLRNHVVSYSHSGQVARRLGVSPRTLGKLTGNVWLTDSQAPAPIRRGRPAGDPCRASMQPGT